MPRIDDLADRLRGLEARLRELGAPYLSGQG